MDEQQIKLVFVGNLPADVKPEQIREFFENKGVSLISDSNPIDIKLNFAFVRCIHDDRLDENIKNMHGLTLIDYEKRPLTVQYAKTDQSDLKRKIEKRNEVRVPTSCLFVVGYDPLKIKPHYLEYEFENIAKVKRIEIMKTFSYVYFHSVDDAKAVLQQYHGKELFGKVLTIEFRTAKGDRDDRSSRDRGSSRRDSSSSSSMRVDRHDGRRSMPSTSYDRYDDRPSSSYRDSRSGYMYDDPRDYQRPPPMMPLDYDYRSYDAYEYQRPPPHYDMIRGYDDRYATLPHDPHMIPYRDMMYDRRSSAPPLIPPPSRSRSRSRSRERRPYMPALTPTIHVPPSDAIMHTSSYRSQPPPSSNMDNMTSTRRHSTSSQHQSSSSRGRGRDDAILASTPSRAAGGGSDSNYHRSVNRREPMDSLRGTSSRSPSSLADDDSTY